MHQICLADRLAGLPMSPLWPLRRWKCELFASADFEQAKSKFSELYKEIHNTIIKIEGEKPFILNGKYEFPEEEKKLTTIPFQLLPSSANMRQLKVELQLEHGADWKITLRVCDHEGQSDVAVGE